MGHYDANLHQQAFQCSFAVVFVFHDDRMVGFGRALSDGAYQAAIYDFVVIPDYQGKGIGQTILKRLCRKIAHCNVILYANPGREGFYAKAGFCMLKTGMGRFLNPQKMEEKGIL